MLMYLFIHTKAMYDPIYSASYASHVQAALGCTSHDMSLADTDYSAENQSSVPMMLHQCCKIHRLQC